MSTAIVVAGTGTDVGKTVFAAALTHALRGYYWKPIQAGLADETDSQIVERLGGLATERIIAEAYRLSKPASPHYAAEQDGVTIEPGNLNPPSIRGPLVIETAGGLAVPITRTLLQIDLLAHWRLPVILCAGTQLGTISHSLLSIEALRRRAIPVVGISFIGHENADSEITICAFGNVRHLGRLPILDPLTSGDLHAAFAANFNIAEILGIGDRGP